MARDRYVKVEIAAAGECSHCAAHGKAIADRHDADVRLMQFFDQRHVTKDVGVAHVIERFVIGK